MSAMKRRRSQQYRHREEAESETCDSEGEDLWIGGRSERQDVVCRVKVGTTKRALFIGCTESVIVLLMAVVCIAVCSLIVCCDVFCSLPCSTMRCSVLYMFVNQSISQPS